MFRDMERVFVEMFGKLYRLPACASKRRGSLKFEVRAFFFKTLQGAGASIATRQQADMRVLKKIRPNTSFL